MELIKKIFPMAFTLKLDLSTLIVDTIIHLFIIFGLVIAGDLLALLGVVGTILFWISRIGIAYVVASIVFSILHYFNVIK